MKAGATKEHARSDKGGTHNHLKLFTVPKKYKKDFLGRFDKRTVIYQHLNEGYLEILNDLGGEEQCSHIKASLCQKFIWLEFLMKDLENRIAQRIAERKPPGRLFNRWIYAAKNLNSLAHRLGLERKRKMIESSLSEYVGRKRKKNV